MKTYRQLHLQEYISTLQWRHNKHDGVSNHRCLDCLTRKMFPFDDVIMISFVFQTLSFLVSVKACFQMNVIISRSITCISKWNQFMCVVDIHYQWMAPIYDIFFHYGNVLMPCPHSLFLFRLLSQISRRNFLYMHAFRHAYICISIRMDICGYVHVCTYKYAHTHRPYFTRTDSGRPGFVPTKLHDGMFIGIFNCPYMIKRFHHWWFSIIINILASLKMSCWYHCSCGNLGNEVRYSHLSTYPKTYAHGFISLSWLYCVSSLHYCAPKFSRIEFLAMWLLRYCHSASKAFLEDLGKFNN